MKALIAAIVLAFASGCATLSAANTTLDGFRAEMNKTGYTDWIITEEEKNADVGVFSVTRPEAPNTCIVVVPHEDVQAGQILMCYPNGPKVGS